MREIPEGVDRQQYLADVRTDLAEQRTVLAEERTYSAWVRTGLAAMATGFAIAKLMGQAEPAWLLRLLGAVFIAAGGCMYAVSFWAYRQSMRKMGDQAAGIPIWVVSSLTVALLVGAATVLALLFV